MAETLEDNDSSIIFPKPPTPLLNESLHLPHEASSNADPPPPYPSRDRRNRTGAARTSRRIARSASDATGAPSILSLDEDPVSPTEHTTESTPLLVPRRRPRTISHSSATSSHSLAFTVLSLFQPEDDQNTTATDTDSTRPADKTFSRRFRRYMRPLWKATYYKPLFHLLVINLPYALIAFVYLFVGTLTGTTLLIALPLGAVLCWFNLIGARAFARGELALQNRFHGPLPLYSDETPSPIFSRRSAFHLSSILEAGEAASPQSTSFLRNTYAMFTDPTSYQAIFYFLVIKPSVTLFLSIALLCIVPLSFALIFPAPAVLRAVKRVGSWQASIAIEGLLRPRL